MRVPLYALTALLALQGLSFSQVVLAEEAKSPQAKAKQGEAKQGEGAHDNIFYKAFYLERGARNLAQAIPLYKSFLAKAPDSPLAPRAASYLVNSLYRADRVEEAREVEAKYSALIAKARTERRPSESGGRRGRGGFGGRGERGGRGGRGERGGRGGREGGGDTAAQIQRLETQVQRYERLIEQAQESGDAERVQRLKQRLTRANEQLKRLKEGGGGTERGGRGTDRPRGGRGRRGGRRGPPLTEMSKEELQNHVDQMGNMVERFSERLEEMGETERAEEMKKNFKKYKDLIKAGKLEDAQKLRSEIFGRRRR